MKKSIAAVAVAAVLTVTALSGCSSDADRASENMSTKAEQFEVPREIIGINTRSGEYLFHYVGRCSLESRESSLPGYLQIMCKHGENDYRKHYERESPDTAIHITQLAPIDVSVYHTEIVVKPENIIPEFNIQTGKQ